MPWRRIRSTGAGPNAPKGRATSEGTNRLNSAGAQTCGSQSPTRRPERLAPKTAARTRPVGSKAHGNELRGQRHRGQNSRCAFSEPLHQRLTHRNARKQAGSLTFSSSQVPQRAHYGNQQGDYSGLVSFDGVSHPIWTDSRDQLKAASGCRTNLLMEEVFTASIGRKTGR